MHYLNGARRFALLVIASQLIAAAPAQAAGYALMGTDFLGLLQAVSQNQCTSYQYDKNGNRLTVNSSGFGSTGTWGSSVYGCFSWTP
jgi:hypothetical protein